MACEFLLLNGSNIDAIDRNGETALHLATEKGFTQLAYLLLKHKANYNIDNKMGKKAIDIAVDQVGKKRNFNLTLFYLLLVPFINFQL